jgi:serine/threonine-protein phosphatase 2A regulatory subunit A
LDLTVIEEDILPMINKLILDPIPNIRFNVAKSYSVLIDVLKRLPAEGTIVAAEKAGEAPPTPSPHGMEVIQEKVVPNLEKLEQDSDVDVRFFAQQAAHSITDDMQTSP